MDINYELYVELLQNELIYERTEHQAALADLEFEERLRIDSEYEIVKLKKQIEELKAINDQFRRNIKYLKKEIWDLGKEVFEQEMKKC